MVLIAAVRSGRTGEGCTLHTTLFACGSTVLQTHVLTTVRDGMERDTFAPLPGQKRDRKKAFSIYKCTLSGAAIFRNREVCICIWKIEFDDAEVM